MENRSQPVAKKWAGRFFTIWVGQAFSLFGSAIVQFALVWYLTQKTGSATILATATLVALLPQILLGPFAGTLVDRQNRRMIMIVADAGIALTTAVLIYLFTTHQIQIWQIYAAAMIRSLGGAFHQPAMTSSTSLMVPDQHLARIAGANQTLQGVINIFAPPLGALLLGVYSTQTVLSIDIVTAAIAILPLLFISIPQPPRQVKAEEVTQKNTYLDDLRAGFAYVIRWKGLLGLILLAMALNFFIVPAASLMPLIITKIFHGGAAQLGWTESLFGAGIIAGGITLSIWGGFKRRIITSFCGIAGIGLGTVFAGLVPANTFYLLLAAWFLVGFSQVFANGPLMAIMQSTVEPSMQGRVFSLLVAGATAMMPLSLLIAGPVSDRVGIRFWYIFGGCACILMVIAASFNSAIMNIENNHLGAQPSHSAEFPDA
jgi:MFS transporter, DHA3 family, macrolide efflux protein